MESGRHELPNNGSLVDLAATGALTFWAVGSASTGAGPGPFAMRTTNG